MQLASNYTVYLNSERTAAYFVDTNEMKHVLTPSFSINLDKDQLTILEMILAGQTQFKENKNIKMLAKYYQLIKLVKERRVILG